MRTTKVDGSIGRDVNWRRLWTRKSGPSMIVVTGGAGFIGSNLIQALNAEGETKILVVDRLGENFRNLRDLRFCDFMEPKEFRQAVEHGSFPPPSAIFHQGACADTTCSDGHYMMENNFSFSKALLRFALERKIP